MIAEYEREKIKERSRRGTLYKAKAGCVNVLSGAPYGYVYIPKRDTHQARYEIHPQEAQVVQRIFALYTKYHYLLSGLLSCQRCGYSLYGKPASNSRYKRCYYRCAGQDGYRWPTGRVCDGHPVRVDVLDELVWQNVEQRIQHPQLVLQE